MKIFVRVKPGAKVEKVKRVAENSFNVSVKAPAKEDKANPAAVKALAAYFKIPRSSIHIKSGLKSKNKIVEIFE